jgi:hypothetical protein
MSIFGRQLPFLPSPGPIPLILLLLGQNYIKYYLFAVREYGDFFMGIFQKFAIWDATRVACGGGYDLPRNRHNISQSLTKRLRGFPLSLAL